GPVDESAAVAADAIVGAALGLPPAHGAWDEAAAGCVGADVVALDDVARRAAARDGNAVSEIAADEVSATGRVAADRVARRAVVDDDAAAGVAQRRSTRNIGTN